MLPGTMLPTPITLLILKQEPQRPPGVFFCVCLPHRQTLAPPHSSSQGTRGGDCNNQVTDGGQEMNLAGDSIWKNLNESTKNLVNGCQF